MAENNHPFYEDVMALCMGTIFVALGLHMFNTLGLLTGGTAGLALLSTYLFPLNFGSLFFIINLPFYYLAWRELGWRFTLNTFVSVTMVSLMSENMHRFISLEQLDPLFAAVVGGLLIGMGLLILFRHKSSLGGLGILAFFLQSRFGWSAGKFQLAVDSCILVASFFVVTPQVVVISILAAVCMNLVLTLNHRPGRYQASQFSQPEKSPLAADTN